MPLRMPSTALHHIQQLWLGANGCFEPVPIVAIHYINTHDPLDFIGHREPWSHKSWAPENVLAQAVIAMLPEFTFAVSLMRIGNGTQGE